MYDIAIIGSGPAGVAAAIHAQIRRRSFILFGVETESSKLKKAEIIRNYPGIPEITGKELAEKYTLHLNKMGISVLKKSIDHVYPMGDYYVLACGDEMWEARSIILATGVSAQSMVDGEEALLGRGVSYCATCDGMLYRGKHVAVLAYNAQALEEAEYLKGLAKVTYIPLSKDASVLPDAENIVDQSVKKICIENGRMCVQLTGRNLEADGVFVFRTAIAPGILVPGLETENGCVKAAHDLSTNLPGVFAAGDVTGAPYQIAKAVGEGTTAALSAVKYVSEFRRTTA